MSLSDLSAAEVDYEHTALKTVVCQLQFHPILRIGKEAPAELQEAIRAVFPVYERRDSQMLFSFRLGPSAEREEPLSHGSTHVFKSEEGNWTATLGNNSVGVETSSHVHFEDFMNRLNLIRTAAEREYKIPSYTRAGLRYINNFSPTEFPGGWGARFNPWLLGALADPDLVDDIEQSQQVVRFRLPSGNLNLIHGLNPDKSYTVDLDHSIEGKLECHVTNELLAEFNRGIYQAFRWSISAELHEEMRPHAR